MFDGLDVLRKELCPWPCVVTDPKGAVILYLSKKLSRKA